MCLHILRTIATIDSMNTPTITYSPKQYAEVPRAWGKAAGVLRASVKRNVSELKKLRREWNKRA